MRAGSVWVCAAAFAVLLTAGCKEGGDPPKDTRQDIHVRGRLMDGSKPWVYEEAKLNLPKGVSAPPGPGGAALGIQVQFQSVEPGGGVFTCDVNPAEGTFEPKGLKAGKYKIAVFSPGMMSGPGDPFKGQFAVGKTKIVRDVADGDYLTIDVSKPTG